MQNKRGKLSNLQRQHNKRRSTLLAQRKQFGTHYTCNSVSTYDVSRAECLIKVKHSEHCNSLVQVFNSTERLQSVAKYFLSSSCLGIVSKSRRTELDYTARQKPINRPIR